MLATTNRRMMPVYELRSADFALPYSQLFTTSKTEVNAIDFGVNYKFDAGSAPVPWERVLAVQPASLAYKVPSAGHASAEPVSVSALTAAMGREMRPAH